MTSHPIFTDSPERWLRLLERAANHLRLAQPEDIAQDVVRAFLTRWANNPTPVLRTFLDVVRANCRAGHLHARCWRELRRMARRRRNRWTDATGDLQELNSLQGRDDPTSRLESSDLVECLLRGATPNERILAECLMRGFAIGEIARNLSCPLRTVYSWRERLERRAIRLGILNRHTDNSSNSGPS